MSSSPRPYLSQDWVARATHEPLPSHEPLHTVTGRLDVPESTSLGVHAAPWVAFVATQAPALHECAQSEPAAPVGEQSMPSRLVSFSRSRMSASTCRQLMGIPLWEKSG